MKLKDSMATPLYLFHPDFLLLEFLIIDSKKENNGEYDVGVV